MPASYSDPELKLIELLTQPSCMRILFTLGFRGEEFTVKDISMKSGIRKINANLYNLLTRLEKAGLIVCTNRQAPMQKGFQYISKLLDFEIALKDKHSYSVYVKLSDYKCPEVRYTVRFMREYDRPNLEVIYDSGSKTLEDLTKSS